MQKCAQCSQMLRFEWQILIEVGLLFGSSLLLLMMPSMTLYSVFISGWMVIRFHCGYCGLWGEFASVRK
jgi:hypothetical protein